MSHAISGKSIAETIKLELIEEISLYPKEIIFSIIYIGNDPVIDNFIRYKKKFGAEIGVSVVVHSFDKNIKEEELLFEIEDISKNSDAVIVQLPLPVHFNTEIILNAVPFEKDVDVLSRKAKEIFQTSETFMIPPVTGAIIESLKATGVEFKNKNIVVVGYGDLVGKPFCMWLEKNNIGYTLLKKDTNEGEKEASLKSADIIVSGVGSPNLIQADMIQEGVILLDAGTSESGKKIVGDIDGEAYKKAAYYTPVPGGIGPITIAVLYRNIISRLNT